MSFHLSLEQALSIRLLVVFNKIGQKQKGKGNLDSPSKAFPTKRKRPSKLEDEEPAKKHVVATI